MAWFEKIAGIADGYFGYLLKVGSFGVTLYVIGSSLILLSRIRESLGPLKFPVTQYLWLIPYFWRKIFDLRTSYETRVRDFIELSILRTEGRPVSYKVWGEIVDEFKDLVRLSSDTSPYTIKVESVFDISSQDLNGCIRDYFALMLKKPKYFGMKKGEARGFRNTIQIKKGYLAPLTFITGLQDRFSEDWKEIIGQYESIFDQKSQNDIIATELYMTYAWLMWGPSLHIPFGDHELKLIQYGYGDENNSVDVLLYNDDLGKKLWELLEKATTERNQIGMNCSLTGKIIDNQTYLKCEKPSEHSALLKSIRHKNFGPCFVVEYQKHEIEYKKRDYYSAYIWILFEQLKMDEEGKLIENENKFEPRSSLIFFEHANLADIDSYKFLNECLMDKMINYFIKTFASPECNSRAYGFCAAMNDDIKERFKCSVEKIKSDINVSESLRRAFETRLRLAPKHPPEDLFKEYNAMLSRESS